MRTSRVALIGATAILALGAAALVVIQLTVDSQEGGDGAAAVPLPAPAETGPLAPLPPLPPLPMVAPSPYATPEQQTWEQVRPMTKPFAPVVRAIRPLVEKCFDEEIQARYGPQPHTSTSDARGSGPGPATLMLQMEGASGGLLIVDAPVAKLGNAGDGLVACVQQALRGRTVPLLDSQYQPGVRVAMAYPLSPSSRQGASMNATAAGAGARPDARPFQRQRGKGVPPVTR